LPQSSGFKQSTNEISAPVQELCLCGSILLTSPTDQSHQKQEGSVVVPAVRPPLLHTCSSGIRSSSSPKQKPDLTYAVLIVWQERPRVFFADSSPTNTQTGQLKTDMATLDRFQSHQTCRFHSASLYMQSRTPATLIMPTCGQHSFELSILHTQGVIFTGPDQQVPRAHFIIHYT
jgi:hypothetical protein